MDLIEFDSDQQICRICLTDSGEMNSIFQNPQNIANVIMSFVNVQICENDGLPDLICSNCLFEANSVCLFKQKCEESDKILRNRFQNVAYFIKIEQPPQSIPAGNDELDDIFNDRHCTDVYKLDSKLSEIDQNETFETVHYSDNFDEEIKEKNQEDETEVEQMQMPMTEDMLITTQPKRRGAKKDVFEPSNNGKTKLQCGECDESFDKKIDLKRHQAVDHINIDGEKKFECIECKKTYSTEQHLTIHMKTHSGKIYDCDGCDKKFQRLDILIEHKKRHSNDRSYLCTNCGKGFYNQTYLDRHMQIHMKEKPVHQCLICGKVMAHSNHLMVHMRAHKDRTGPLVTESKNVILCSVCGKSCSSRSNLAVHMRRHTGKMTNFCSVCGKGYPRTTDLTIHMRQHTGEKPFRCHVCKRRFARSDKLAIHMRTHTGEKPYVCSVCGRAFAQSNDLASHKRRNACSAVLIRMDPSESFIGEKMQIDTCSLPATESVAQLVDGKSIDEQRIVIENHNRLPNCNRNIITEPTLTNQRHCNNQQFQSILPNFTTTAFR